MSTELATMPQAAYRAAPGLSASDLKLILRSPAHWLHQKREPREATTAMELGTAVHCRVLEPANFATTYAAAPDFDRRTKIGREAWENWQAGNSGKVPLSREDGEAIAGMAGAIQAHPAASRLLALPATIEGSIFWSAEGLAFKARPDFIADKAGIILDLKTCRDASPEEFARQAANLQYHLSATHYIYACQAHFRRLEWTAVFVAAESSPPYAVACYALDQDSLNLGAALRAQAIHRYQVWMESDSDISGGYSPGVMQLSLPKWAWGKA